MKAIARKRNYGDKFQLIEIVDDSGAVVSQLSVAEFYLELEDPFDLRQKKLFEPETLHRAYRAAKMAEDSLNLITNIDAWCEHRGDTIFEPGIKKGGE